MYCYDFYWNKDYFTTQKNKIVFLDISEYFTDTVEELHINKKKIPEKLSLFLDKKGYFEIKKRFYTYLKELL